MGTTVSIPGVTLSASSLTLSGAMAAASIQDTGISTAGPVVSDASGNFTSVAYGASAGSVLTSTGSALSFLTTTLSATALTFAKGSGAINLTQSAQTTDVACTDFSVTPQAPFASATGTNRNAGNAVVALAAPAGAATAEARLKITRGGSFSAAIGPYESAGGTYSAVYLGPGITPASSNYNLLSDGGNTKVNAPSGGNVQLQVAGGAALVTVSAAPNLVKFGAAHATTRTALTYSATIATDASLGCYFTIAATDTSAYTISDPTNAADGQVVTYDIKNSSGGTMGAITWGSTKFALAGAFTNPANGKRRTITFRYNSADSKWVELCRAAADI